MDHIFAIGFGLGLRFFVDAVTHHDFKITGTLVGLWEGVILLHFTKKTPKSNDPFTAYGVRLFIDFLCTDSVTRLVVVLVWTALGMVLADVTPAIWDEVGLKRVWRDFGHDLNTISRMIPTIAFISKGPPPRAVRFSKSKKPSITDAVVDAVSPPSVIPTEQTKPVPATAPAAKEVLRRPVPSDLPVDFSDTETELGSVRSPSDRTSRRFFGSHDLNESISTLNDLDDENLSSVLSVTEGADQSSTAIDTSTIPNKYIDEEPLVDVVVPVEAEDEMMTPKPPAAPYMPPTPSDSAPKYNRLPPQPSEDPLPVRQLSELTPTAKFLGHSNADDWEKIQHREANESNPPTPPAKDDEFKPKVPIIVTPVPPQPRQKRPSTTPFPRDEAKGWDVWELQFLSIPNDNDTSTSSNNQRGYAYRYPDHDDRYRDDVPAPQYRPFPAREGGVERTTSWDY